MVEIRDICPWCYADYSSDSSVTAGYFWTRHRFQKWDDEGPWFERREIVKVCSRDCRDKIREWLAPMMLAWPIKP